MHLSTTQPSKRTNAERKKKDEETQKKRKAYFVFMNAGTVDGVPVADIVLFVPASFGHRVPFLQRTSKDSTHFQFIYGVIIMGGDGVRAQA